MQNYFPGVKSTGHCRLLFRNRSRQSAIFFPGKEIDGALSTDGAADPAFPTSNSKKKSEKRNLLNSEKKSDGTGSAPWGGGGQQKEEERRLQTSILKKKSRKQKLLTERKSRGNQNF